MSCDNTNNITTEPILNEEVVIFNPWPRLTNETIRGVVMVWRVKVRPSTLPVKVTPLPESSTGTHSNVSLYNVSSMKVSIPLSQEFFKTTPLVYQINESDVPLIDGIINCKNGTDYFHFILFHMNDKPMYCMIGQGNFSNQVRPENVDQLNNRFIFSANQKRRFFLMSASMICH